MIKHRIYRDHDLIVAVLVGNINVASMKELIDEADKLIAALKKEHKPICILADLSKFGHSDMAARKWGTKSLRHWPVHKVAICGGNVMERMIAKILINTSGKGKILRYFNNVGKARLWIEE